VFLGVDRDLWQKPCILRLDRGTGEPQAGQHIIQCRIAGQGVAHDSIELGIIQAQPPLRRRRDIGPFQTDRRIFQSMCSGADIRRHATRQQYGGRHGANHCKIAGPRAHQLYPCSISRSAFQAHRIKTLKHDVVAFLSPVDVGIAGTGAQIAVGQIGRSIYFPAFFLLPVSPTPKINIAGPASVMQCPRAWLAPPTPRPSSPWPACQIRPK
jgi:hypothetical protein